MSEFNKDDYLRDLPDAESLSGGTDTGSDDPDSTQQPEGDAQSPQSTEHPQTADSDTSDDSPVKAQSSSSLQDTDQSSKREEQPEDDQLTPLGNAKKEAAEYLEALQRERAEFINFRNRSVKEQERSRQHGIIDVLMAELPALDDIDRIREHGQLDDSTKAVADKIDKAFAKFGVEKFGEAGEDFDPTKHEAVLHKPDPNATKETVDAVVEAGYRIGDRVIRAARVVVSSPQQ